MDPTLRTERKLVPPDGGWGWIVILGAGLATFNLSLFGAFGLIFGKEIERMGEGTKGVALVANVMFLMYNIIGPISGQLIKKTSYRQVTIAGSTFSALGMILSSFTTSLWHLVITYGVFVGIGLGMIVSATFVGVNSYFVEKKGRAVGLCLCGAGIGQVVMPQIVKYLLTEYSFRGTTLILGGLCLNGVVGGALLQPVQWHMKVSEDRPHEKVSFLIKNPNENNTVMERDNGDIEEEIVNPGNKEDRSTNQDEGRKKSLIQSLVSSFDLTLLTKVRFVLVLLGCALAHASLVNFEMIFPFIMQDVVKVNTRYTAIAMSVTAGADLFGRFAIPMITDRFKIRALHCLMFACAYLAVIRQLMIYNTLYTTALIYAALNGLGMTIVTVYNNITVSNECKGDQVPSAIGLSMLTRGIIVLPAGFFVGWIRDYVNSYLVCVTVLNAFNIMVVFLWVPLVLSELRKSDKSH